MQLKPGRLVSSSSDKEMHGEVTDKTGALTLTRAAMRFSAEVK